MIFNNPVFRRESRVRWRGWRSFALLFFYAISLSTVLGWGYATNGAGNNAALNSDTLATTGRAIFRILQMMQMIAWLLMVPVLTSTIISSERERGLLEALQLSGLRARHIIGGKLGAIFMFVVLLLLVGAPVTSICFLLGGIAPEEFLKSLLLQAMTILLCSALGLYYSSQARRSLVAVRNSFIAMLLFAVATAFAQLITDAASLDLRPLSEPLTLLNPFRAQMGVFDNFATTYPELMMIKGMPHPFLFTLAGLALFSLLFLWGAARGVRKVFDDAQWMERKRYLTWQNGRFKWRDAQVDEAALARWNRESDTEGGAKDADLKAKTSALLDTPLANFIHFQNPVLQREVRGKLRVRRYPKPLTVLMSVLAAFGGLVYMYAIFEAWWDVAARRDIWNGTIFCSLAAITLAMPLMGAGTLPRERDSGTWEMLESSLLPPRELLIGKLLAPLFFAAAVFVILLPILLPTIRFFGFEADYHYDGPSLPYALATFCLLATTSFCFVAWGMWLSSFFRTPTTAMSVTLISMLLGVGFLPWPALSALSEREQHSAVYTLLFEAVYIVLLVFCGFLLLLDLNRRIRKAWRLPHQALLDFPKRKTAPAKESA